MSCGVRYEFSLVPEPKTAKVIAEDMKQLGTPHDAEEAGAADPRLSDREHLGVDVPPRGRQGPKR